MTGKQRAWLRGKANSIGTVIQIGKSGVTPEVVGSVDEALEARELIKVAVLPSCEAAPAGAAEALAGRAKAECVQVIGRKIVLYRKSKTKPAILLPK
jgi:RNA-binding protein